MGVPGLIFHVFRKGFRVLGLGGRRLRPLMRGRGAGEVQNSPGGPPEASNTAQAGPESSKARSRTPKRKTQDGPRGPPRQSIYDASRRLSRALQETEIVNFIRFSNDFGLPAFSAVQRSKTAQ
eukprot:9313752-Pyramimonas_sp.AAC.1